MKDSYWDTPHSKFFEVFWLSEYRRSHNFKPKFGCRFVDILHA